MHRPQEPFDTGVFPAELDPERPRAVDTPWGTLALFVVDGEVRCVQAFCPHLQGPLFQGSVARGVVTCPWHGWRYDLRNGERVDWRKPLGGPDAAPLLRCEVEQGPAGTLRLLPPQRDT